MLGALIIVFREVFEAGLILGIVLAAANGVPKAGRWIGMGLAAGLAGATLLASFVDVIANAMQGVGQEVFNACILASAVLMLAWHNIWMARHGREMSAELKGVGQAVKTGNRSLLALAVVVGVAVLREGSEVVLFLYGVLIQGGEGVGSLALGGLLGTVLGGCVSALMYFGLTRIPTRRLFSVTTGLITLLAAGMAAQSVFFLEQSGLVDVFGRKAWDTSTVLSDKSILGRALHTLIGYSDAPTVLQVLVYGVTLVGLFAFTKMMSPAAPKFKPVQA